MDRQAGLAGSSNAHEGEKSRRALKCSIPGCSPRWFVAFHRSRVQSQGLQQRPLLAGRNRNLGPVVVRDHQWS